jgi:hypothetical protein
MIEINGIQLHKINEFINIADQDEFADDKEYMFEVRLVNDRILRLQAHELRIIRRIGEYLEKYPEELN